MMSADDVGVPERGVKRARPTTTTDNTSRAIRTNDVVPFAFKWGVKANDERKRARENASAKRPLDDAPIPPPKKLDRGAQERAMFKFGVATKSASSKGAASATTLNSERDNDVYADTWCNALAEVEADLAKKRADRAELLKEPWERVVRTTTRSALEQGHDNIVKIHAIFKRLDECMGMSRTPTQAKIQNMAIATCAPSIYGKAFDTNRLAIMKKNRWGANDLAPWLVVTMPRRAGKTTSNCQLALALLAAIPNMKIVVVAPTLKQAELFVKQVADYFHEAKMSREFPTFAQSTLKFTIKKSRTDERTILALTSGINVRCCSLSRSLALSLSRRYVARSLHSPDSEPHVKPCVAVSPHACASDSGCSSSSSAYLHKQSDLSSCGQACLRCARSTICRAICRGTCCSSTALCSSHKPRCNSLACST